MDIHGCKITPVALFIIIQLQILQLGFVAATDSITSSQFIKDSEALVSPGSIFKLGFFSPENSTNRYAGIWYNHVPALTPIWVANRNKPLTDSSGILRVSEDGNLVVLNGQEQVLWSSNVSGVYNSTAQLNDEGNFVLFDSNGNSLWESFQEPCNILVEGMRLTADKNGGKKTMLTSWKSPSDPSTGSFSAGIDPLGIPQLFVWNEGHPYLRSGPWNGRVFIGIPDMNSVYLYGVTLATYSNGVLSLSFSLSNQSLLFNSLSSEGELAENIWVSGTQKFESDWKFPSTTCDLYGICGVFGVCDAQNAPICSCLKGFEPKNPVEWAAGNWTAGCVRRTSLQCDIQNSTEVAKDGFLRLQTMKVPDFAQWSTSNEQQCREACLNFCSCNAYSYYPDFGCMSWTENLIDTQTFSRGGADLFIRLAYAELGSKRNIKTIIGLTLSAGILCTLVVAYLSWRWLVNHGESKKISEETLLNGRTRAAFSDADMFMNNKNQAKLLELPVFDLQKLITATDNFHEKNKLGQGGFGHVYKGEFPDGQEIAVKRLSRASGQGFEEFMNEVVVISKLQHRNLVRLFGCCVEGEEKMLIYEYLPNKSLDAFLFDSQRKEQLDWRKRVEIVQGICRGLLYLHRDSRLKIIHRDLKASNILLDHQLNPKISDFGMARIFGGDEDQANTKRVVGTYGYMSPEYAMEGRFSEKSDVYSLGVLLLEIISGRRNTSFYENDQALSLLGYAWKLWSEGNITGLKDPVLDCEKSDEEEIIRCINVGLLCVQESAKDRPNVSTVISMLNRDIVDLPLPKQPAFAERRIGLDSDSSQRGMVKCSDNMVTITVVDGR